MTDLSPRSTSTQLAAPSSEPPQPLGSLLRKAAVDAGFDLEPEAEGTWWRVRSTAAPGVVWVRPLPQPNGGALLALPLASQLAELDPALLGLDTPNIATASLPPGAGGEVFCRSPEVLHAALRRVWTLRVTAPARLRARWDAEVATQLGAGLQSATPATEVLAEIRRRVGQDVFRDALLDYWDGCCAVTGLSARELLRASHAKPWAVANDSERLDVYNGLLLAVHLDALFDQGFLTFDAAGHGLLSEQLTSEARTILGLSSAPLVLKHVHAAHDPYLAYHRAHVFRS